MCGLAGILLPTTITKLQLENVRRLFVENLLANEQRGPKATGVVVCQEDGTLFSLKRAVAASEFVKMQEFHNFMVTHVSSKTRILLGHTREPTKGPVTNYDNNHPIIVGDTVGVHNGVSTNDDAIFLELAQKVKPRNRIGSVDSEAIFALFDEVCGDLDLGDYVAGIAQRVRCLFGSFTTLFFNKKKPPT